MKAVINTARGSAKETLSVEEIDVPTLDPGSVLVAIRASGVNPSDTKLRSGAQGPMVASQIVIHNDGAGVIEAVGKDVDPARVGERVWLFNVNRTSDGLGQGTTGTAAEYVVVPSDLAASLPDATSFEQGACLGVPAMTAHRAVTCAGPVSAKTVLVTGGAGSVGHAAIQIAKAMGARVLTTVSSDQKAEIAQEAGADVVINYREEDLKARLLEEAPDRIDHVVDVDFAAHVDLYPEVLKLNASVGAYATATNLTPAFPFYPLAFRNISIQPVFVYAMSAEAKAAAIADVNSMLSAGKLKPLVDRVFDMSQVVAAHEAVEEGRLLGNAVLQI